MKKKTLAIIAAIIVVLIVAALLVFVKCDKTPQPEAPVGKVFLGGVVASGSTQQLFAKIYVRLPLANSPYKAKIEGIPEKLVPSNDNNTQDQYYEIQFYASPPKGSEGDYPYKITVSSEKDKFEFEGKLIVGQNTGSPDKLDGGCGRTGNFGPGDLTTVSVTSKTALSKLVIANPVLCGNTCVIGTTAGTLADGKFSGGELTGFDGTGKQLWKVQVTDNTIEYLQAVGDMVIACDNSAKMFVFDIKELAKNNDRSIARYSASSNLTAPPTVIADDKIVFGTTDGNVVCLSVPDLSKLWSVNFKGSIMGPISAVPLGGGNGSLYFSCTDKTTVALNFDGSLQYYFKHNMKPIGCPVTITDKYAFLSFNNHLQMNQNTGKILWDHYAEFDLTGVPVMNQSQVFVYGKNRLRAVSMDDGTEMWTIELPSAINANPVIVGNSIVVCTEDRNVSIIRTNDGMISNTFAIEGSMIDWPCYADGKMYIADRRGFLFILSKAPKATNLKFDMSQVVANGGKCTLAHNCITNATLPLKPKLLWTLKGSFAPAITTKTRIYLYNIDTKTFQCNNAVDGSPVWSYQAEAVEGVYYGFFFKLGLHETPMFFTQKGLLIGTKSGLVLLDPDTGKELTRSIETGVPQSDGKIIVLTTGESVTVMDMDMKVMWKKKGIYFSSTVTIDGDTIYAARRGDGVGEFEIIETKTGKIVSSFADKLFDISSVKVMNTGKYIVVTTMAGPWIYDIQKDNMLGVSKQLSSYGASIFESNYVNGKLICSSHDFGIEFDLATGGGKVMVPKDAKDHRDYLNAGNWVFTPNGYVCMGYVVPEGKPPKGGKGPNPQDFKRKLQVRTLTSEILASVILEPSENREYGIALSGSTIILSEIGKGGLLRVYGP